MSLLKELYERLQARGCSAAQLSKVEELLKSLSTEPPVRVVWSLSRLTVCNLFCFPAEQKTFEFEPGVVVVSGPNRSGKTSVVQALLWTLYGKCCRGVNPVNLTRRELGCSSMLELRSGEDTLVVTRHIASGTTKQVVKLRMSSGVTIDGANKVLHKVWKMFGDYDQFVSMHLMNSATLPLVLHRPTPILRIIRDQTGLGVLELLVDLVKKDLSAARKELLQAPIDTSELGYQAEMEKLTLPMPEKHELDQDLEEMSARREMLLKSMGRFELVKSATPRDGDVNAAASLVRRLSKELKAARWERGRINLVARATAPRPKSPVHISLRGKLRPTECAGCRAALQRIDELDPPAKRARLDMGDAEREARKEAAARGQQDAADRLDEHIKSLEMQLAAARSALSDICTFHLRALEARCLDYHTRKSKAQLDMALWEGQQTRKKRLASQILAARARNHARAEVKQRVDDAQALRDALDGGRKSVGVATEISRASMAALLGKANALLAELCGSRLAFDEMKGFFLDDTIPIYGASGQQILHVALATHLALHSSARRHVVALQVLDESMAALETGLKRELLAFLEAQAGLTSIVISHDEGVQAGAKRAISLRD